MKNILSRFSLKKSSVKTFLFFLLFTSFLWLFIQFSKNYTQEVVASIRYINLPEDRILQSDSDQKLNLTLNGNGFRLITHLWTTPNLQLDFAEGVETPDGDYYFLVNASNAFLKKKLNFNGRILSVSKDTLYVKLDVNLEKKIPIRLRENIKYAPGYGSGEGINVEPDSVVISGPQKIIDTIQFVYTKHLKLDNLNKDYNGMLPIDINYLPSNVMLTPKEVEGNVKVSKFTEGSQEISISLINVPKGKEIKIFPKDVKIVYRVGLDKYNEVKKKDFEVIADYNAVAEDSSFLMLELINVPSSVHDARLLEKQVQFIILN